MEQPRSPQAPAVPEGSAKTIIYTYPVDTGLQSETVKELTEPYKDQIVERSGKAWRVIQVIPKQRINEGFQPDEICVYLGPCPGEN